MLIKKKYLIQEVKKLNNFEIRSEIFFQWNQYINKSFRPYSVLLWNNLNSFSIKWNIFQVGKFYVISIIWYSRLGVKGENISINHWRLIPVFQMEWLYFFSKGIDIKIHIKLFIKRKRSIISSQTIYLLIYLVEVWNILEGKLKKELIDVFHPDACQMCVNYLTI